MDALIGLSAALIGALAALTGTYLSGLQQAKIEYKKWLRAREDEIDQELREAITALMQKMAVAAQTISWFTWEADYRPDRISKEVIDGYDLEMKALFPQIDSALILVSALRKQAYDDLAPIIQEIYNLDLKVSRETRKFAAMPAEAVQGIAGYKDRAYTLKSEIMKGVASVMEKYGGEAGSLR